MRVGLFISLLIHAGVLGWALISIAPKALNTPVPKPITVDVLTVADLTKLRAGSKKKAKAKPKAKKVAKPKETRKVRSKPKRVATLPPAPKPAEKPKVKPKKKAPKKAKPKPKKPKPVAKPKVKPKPKPKPKRVVKKKPPTKRKKKRKFDPDNIAALLNRDPTAKAGKPVKKPKKKKTARKKAKRKPVPPAPPLGRDKELSITEKQALALVLRRCVSRYWSPPTGAASAAELVVKVRFNLKPDGMLQGPPIVLNPRNTAFHFAAADSAKRAVLQCQPFQLPAKYYEHWKTVTLNFDPREMFGG